MSDSEVMHDEDFANLLAGLKDVRDYRAGKRDGFITHAVLEAQRKGWTACRRRDRYLVLAVPSHVRES